MRGAAAPSGVGAQAGGTPARAGRALRRAPGPPGPPRLAAEAISGNLLFTASDVTAWYVLPPQSWSFRGPGERTALVDAMTLRLTQLAGRRVFLRVTSKPYDASEWASRFDHSIRGRHPVLQGPCPAHAHLSRPGCPSCVPGHAWLDLLAEQQDRIRQWDVADRVVFLGVQVNSRSGLTRMLGGAWSRAADAEVSAVENAAERIGAIASGPGLWAEPATPAQLRWLLARSLGLHLPAPLPVTAYPAPYPYSLPDEAPLYVDGGDLAELAAPYRWTAQPLGKTVVVTRSDGLAVHVAVLTAAGIADQEDSGPSPWISRSDTLDFPTEWVITAVVRRREETAREMRGMARRIGEQAGQFARYDHPVPHGLKRQLAASQHIEDQAQHEQAASRVHAWVRIAVAGDTEKEAIERAAQVAEHYAPGLTIAHTDGQFALARELIPGERLAPFGHRRSMETANLAAGMPAASANVGHPHGIYLGVTTTMARKVVTLHPWHGMENLNQPGVITLTGTPGGGKSAAGGVICYNAVRGGIASVVLDPSGMLHQIAALPEIARVSRIVNLLDASPGTLNPYQLIPDPPALRGGRGAGTDHDGRERRARARAAAAVQRRALTRDILTMLLPARVLDQATEFAIAEAVRTAPAEMDASPLQVIRALRGLADQDLTARGRHLAGILEERAEHPLAALFFPPAGGPGGQVTQGSVLTVMTLPGLVIPGDARPAEERTVEEQLSVAVLHLAAQLLHSLLLGRPRDERKLVVLDEAHQITRTPVGRSQVVELSRDSRKRNTCALIISQNAGDVLAAGIAGQSGMLDGGVGNLVGSVLAFRTTGPREQRDTLGLLGLPEGAGYEQCLADLSAAARAGSGITGECLMRDPEGRIERVQIDLGALPALRAALDSTPSGRPAVPEVVA
jgi:hypothetical protein